MLAEIHDATRLRIHSTAVHSLRKTSIILLMRLFVPKDTQECLLEKVRNSIPSSCSRTLHFCRTSSSQVDRAKIWAHTTSAVYCKLFIGEILPPDIRRVLYLDPDIIVRGDIKELWNHPINLLGAVPDAVNPQELEPPPNEPYFNTRDFLLIWTMASTSHRRACA
jgi:lipopolysaccharide biosynthesis glycosyltransferase